MIDIFDEKDKAQFTKLKTPVVEIVNAVYGLGRSGGDFIYTFASWLDINSWHTIPEEPALHAYWITEDPAVILRRAAANKKYVDAEMRRGRNVLLGRPARTQPVADDSKANLNKLKKIAGSEQKAVVMATYVDDCDMDGKKGARSLMWTVLRFFFESAEPEDVKKLLGIIHEVCMETPSLFTVKMNQKDYLRNALENLPTE